MSQDKAGSVRLEHDERERLRALIDQAGEAAAADRIGINVVTMTRALAGLEVRRGTVALVRVALGSPQAGAAESAQET